MIKRYYVCAHDVDDVPNKNMDSVCMSEDVEKLEDENMMLKEMLKKIEWHEGTFNKYCPVCNSLHRFGHKTDCELAKLIRD